ncbi:MAG: glycosyltransferase family 4 protein [Aulosira sp. ZfuVER01]|nr:glycosyltransferase family 4 protein [Aulosira sp. ZfuVER01]MDZ7998052.1 glycosyltransferase family 4 protein [Aulosira sp. DedVER01a]MDZ8050446.1 glycosyltransferase family 4 protein [Aulosira sp. ZfuCHP01]
MPDYAPALKLLYITTVPETLSFLSGQVGYMKQQGFEVHALSSPGKALHKFAEREQVTVYAVDMPRRITPLQDLVAIFHLWQCLRHIRPQVVHASTPKGGLLGIVSSWLAGSPIRIYLMRGLPLMTAKGFKRWLLWWSEKISCLLAHQVFCVSHSLREVAVSENLCPPSKIKVLLEGSSNGVDTKERFNPIRVGADVGHATRQKYGIPIDALVVGFVGRIVRDKGITELVNAWKILRDEFPNLHLLMVGSFEPQDPVPSDVEEWLKSDARIHLTGDSNNTPAFYAAMDILTLPTYREGFPNTPLEGAAMQLPVVATAIPGCIDAVQDGITGTLVPPRNVEALTAAIRMYLNSQELRQQHGQAGHSRVVQSFNQERIWDALYQEYVRLLLEKGLAVPKPISNLKEAR